MKTRISLALMFALALALTGATFAMAQQSGAGSNGALVTAERPV